MIRLYDSVEGEVCDLIVRDPGRVSMYVCGPTVDNLPHLGHGRFTLVWDVARRWFTFRGLDVTYVSNITDIDDKIIARALLEDQTTAEVVDTYEGEWWSAMDRLGVARPDEAPHATQFVPEMIELMRMLKARYKLKVAVVNNEGLELNQHRIQTFQLASFVDFFVSSCFAHVRKPDEDIFRMALDMAQVPPDEVAYLDDRLMFVQVAENLGIRGIHHTSYASTVKKLTALGLALEDPHGALDLD